MLRRTFLTIASAASPLLSLLSKMKPWPFVEVDWWFAAPCGCDDCHDQLACHYSFRWLSCDMCYESAVDDFCKDSTKEPRKFYRTTDGSRIVICEHCTGEYLNT
jgi:hypothetical protein